MTDSRSSLTFANEHNGDSFVLDMKSSDVPDKSPDNSPKSRKKKGWYTPYLDRCSQFAENTSIHGIRNASDKSRNWFYRLTWAVLVLVGAGTLISMLVNLLKSHAAYPTKTLVTMSSHDQLPFPAVTICNVNGLESSKLFGMDSTSQNLSSTLFGLFLANSLLGSRINETASLADILTYSGEILNVTFQDIMLTSFADVNSTFISCYWDEEDEPCADMFFPLDMDDRRCFTFNGRHHGRRVAKKSGMASGLHVLVDVRQKEYVYYNSMDAGVKVVLHEPGEMPDVTNKGFMAAPGYSTASRVTINKMKYQPSPYKAFGNETCVTSAPLPPGLVPSQNVTYTHTLCRTKCISMRVESACGCRINNFTFQYQEDIKLCTVRDVFTCYKSQPDLLAELVHQECSCPRLCQTTQYQSITSVSYFPSDVALSLLQQTGLLAGHVVDRKNILELKIYFDDLVISEVSQIPEYTVDSILASVGGQMGLFIGASLLSVTELANLLLDLVLDTVRWLWCCALNRPVSPNGRT